MRIGIIGLGGVGKALISLINKKRNKLSDMGLDIDIIYAINSKGGLYDNKGLDLNKLSKHLLHKDIKDFQDNWIDGLDIDSIVKDANIDLLVELTHTNKETGEPGLTHIRKAIEAGIHVVTGNKGPVMLDYKGLYGLAKDNNVQLGIGCTTGGALPSINAGIMDMAGSDIIEIEGVLNGTSNFILKEMCDKSISYQKAILEAQRLGIAESNPSLDVEGWDTGIKLLILTNVLLNKDFKLSEVNIKGITDITEEEVIKALKDNKRYKLVGRTLIQEGVVSMKVEPELLDSNSQLYSIEGKNKGLKILSDTLGELFICGGASGVEPAAASVLRDIVNIFKGYRFII